MAGQEYTIGCSVQSPGAPLTNDDISWSGPSGLVQGPPGRVFVGDVFQDSATGRWVRRLTFSPLSTEDSGPYTCISPQGTRVQTLTVNGEHLHSLTHYHYLYTRALSHQSQCQTPPYHLYPQPLWRNNHCKLIAPQLSLQTSREWSLSPSWMMRALFLLIALGSTMQRQCSTSPEHLPRTAATTPVGSQFDLRSSGPTKVSTVL